MVRTGGFAFSKFGFESTYGALAATRNQVFGLEQKITSHTYTNNKIVLSELSTVFPIKYAFGQARGDISVAFVLSNPWWLKTIFDSKTGAGTIASPYIYSVSSKIMPSISIETDIDETTDVVRIGKGAVVKSVSLSAPIGDVIRCTADIAYGAEDGTQTIGTAQTDNIAFPYTFAYGKLEVNAGGTLRTLAEVQSVDLTLNTNAELLYGLGTGVAAPTNNQSVGAYRQLYEITGRFSLSMDDRADSPPGTSKTLLNTLYAQIGANAQTQSSEFTTLTLTFDNGLATTSRRAIIFKCTAITIDSSSVSIEPNAPIFEDIPFQARGVTVEAITDVTTEPT